MHRLWFVVPVHGRVGITTICLTQLRRTCDELRSSNIDASAVIVGDDENLDTARRLGFATVERDNEFLSRKFNDGIQLACDPAFNPRPAQYVVPCGSDDWVDPAIFDLLPGPDSVIGFRSAAFVDETGTHIAARTIDYEAGVGIRIFPALMMNRLGYRPADEDRKRACDTSILVNLKRSYNGGPTKLTVVYNEHHPYQIVDWKSPGEQLNAYVDIADRFPGSAPADPYESLAPHFPPDAIREMKAHYESFTP